MKIMNDTEQQIKKFLEPFNNEIISLAIQLRDFIKEETKPSTELVGDSTISLNIGYGFTEKAWDCFCAIIVYSKHINISFPSGAFLSDPHGLLQGTGKKIRHIRISNLSDVKAPAVKGFLLEARNRSIDLLSESPIEKDIIRTIIKPISGIKKRPKNNAS